MNQRKARKIRKSLGMTKENFRQKDYKNINPVKKVVYFTNNRGVLVPQETVRTQVINTNLNHYRKVKKGGI